MKKASVSAKKLISGAYEEYEAKREELSAFLADPAVAAVISDYDALRAEVAASAERVKSVYAAHHGSIGVAYRDFTCAYALQLNAERFIELMGDEAEIYVTQVPKIDRDAYDTGVRQGHIPPSVARAVEKRVPRIYTPKK